MHHTSLDLHEPSVSFIDRTLNAPYILQSILLYNKNNEIENVENGAQIKQQQQKKNEHKPENKTNALSFVSKWFLRNVFFLF